MYKYDAHVHTKEASCCGWVKAADVVKYYINAGFDGIIITDHYKRETFESFGKSNWDKKIDLFMSGYYNALKAAKDKNFDVLFGMEITFDDSFNDFLVYGIDEEFLRIYPMLYKLNLKAFKNMINNTNVLIYQAHPFRPLMTREDPQLLDGIEVINGNERHDAQNDVAYKFAVSNNLKQIAGSDFHRPKDEGHAGILLNEKVSTINQLVDILKRQEVKLFHYMEMKK